LKTRILYNQDRKDVRVWQTKMDTFLKSLLGPHYVMTCFVLPPKKEVRIQWKNGEPLLEVFQNLIPEVVAIYSNEIATKFYEKKKVTNKLRRMGKEPAIPC